MDSAWSTYYDMDSLFQNSDFIADNCTSYASVNFHSDEFSDLLDYVSDLLCELSGGSDNEGLSVD